jgi:hypothetical protein
MRRRLVADVERYGGDVQFGRLEQKQAFPQASFSENGAKAGSLPCETTPESGFAHGEFASDLGCGPVAGQISCDQDTDTFC